ncbi:MAG: ASKHA domain-containing protein [Proteobacteria bacterium]|nr:ASKHA domain-containing protein [Pseudomonadota bacterium]
MAGPAKKDYQQRLDQITEIFADIMGEAQDHLQGQGRCPYRTAKDICTAKFGCANRARPGARDAAPICAHDGTLDFRSAWESRPESYRKTRDKIEQVRLQAAAKRGQAQVGGHEDRRAGMEGKAAETQTLFDRADVGGLHLASSCGRYGDCHECIVTVNQGMEALAPRTEAEAFLPEHYRLACQAEIIDAGAEITFEPLIRAPRILQTSFEKPISLAPAVTRRNGEVLRDGEVIDKYRGHILGLAIDLGTTTVAANLFDLQSGACIAMASFENPQRFGGSDVMHRISYDGGPHRGEMHKVIINALNREIEGLCGRFAFNRREIYEIVVAGNSTMRDLFFNGDVQPIGQRPYKSPVELAFMAGERDSTALVVEARKLRLRAHPKCLVHGLPLIASHVGGDAAASLLALDISPDDDDVVMLVDMGTNTEIALAGRGRLMVASCPAGPAFEGGLVRHGMASYDGAIEAVSESDDGGFQWRTIGDVAPLGLCGSGLIDLLAVLRRTDRMNEKGALARDKGKRNAEILIAPHAASGKSITISGLDISHLAQAKAASHAGQNILMRRFGVGADDISRLYLAGGFASHVDFHNAVEIGLLAPVAKDRMVKAGNSALLGAGEALLNTGRRAYLEQLVRRAEHVELESEANFFEIFVEACFFKPMQ